MANQSSENDFLQQLKNNAAISRVGFWCSDTYVARFDSTFGWEHLDKDFNAIFGRAIARPCNVLVNGCRDAFLCVRNTKRLRESHSLEVSDD